jgi:hydrogenase-4 component F
MSWAIYAILGAPLGATLLSLLGEWPVARAASVVAGLLTFALTILLAVHLDRDSTLWAADAWFRLDSLGAVFLVPTGLLYAMAGVFSIGYFAGREREVAFAGYIRRYYALLNLFGFSMVLVPIAADLGTLWVAVELTTIVSALLVALDRTDAALEAAWKYVLIASCGLGIALLAIILLYAAGTGPLGNAYVPRFDRLLPVARHLSSSAVRTSFVLAIVGFGTKVGFVPTHTWLPDAHSEAPAPVSALLSGALLAAAFYAILRFFQVTVAAGDRAFGEHVLLVFGALSLVSAALFVLRQANFKRLFAYSSIEHMGVIALGIGFGAPLAVAGALLHVITHASAKGLAFLGSGSLLRRYDTKDVEQVSGAARAMPLTGPMFMAAALTLSGLPLSGVFRSEFQIVAGGFAQAQYVPVSLLIVFVNLAFFGIVWHVGRMVLTGGGDAVRPGEDAGRAGGDAMRPVGEDAVRPGEASWWMVAGMAGCLFVSVALGLHVPSALSHLLSSAAHELRLPRT